MVGLISAAAWQLTHLGANPDHQPMYLSPQFGQSFAQSLNIPGFSTRNLAIRLSQYVGGTDIFLQYPLTGFGGANYTYVALNYAPQANMIHNLYIGVFAETGFVGGVLFFGAMVLSLRGVWLTASRDDSPLWLGYLIGFVGFFALQMFQPQYLRPVTMVSVFGLLGIGYGTHLRNRSQRGNTWTTVWNRSSVQRAMTTAYVTQTIAKLPDMSRVVLRVAWMNSRIRQVLPAVEDIVRVLLK
jgi:O-antigen ligase